MITSNLKKTFVNWCNANYLYLNMSKTKDMCIDLRKKHTCLKTVTVKGEVVEGEDTLLLLLLLLILFNVEFTEVVPTM